MTIFMASLEGTGKKGRDVEPSCVPWHSEDRYDVDNIFFTVMIMIAKRSTSTTSTPYCTRLRIENNSVLQYFNII